MQDVLLVQMPFANLRWPSLALGLLKAGVQRRGIRCDVAYLNFDFAEAIGGETYSWIADQFAFVLGGERLFARHLFSAGLPDDDAYFREVLQPADCDFDASSRGEYESVAAAIGPFLDRAMAEITWRRYGAVGFTTAFQQTMASLCLARRIRTEAPGVKILFGGAACEGEMGRELIRCFPDIDYIFLGNADHAFPDVVEQILRGGPVQLPPGVVEQAGPNEPLPAERNSAQVERQEEACMVEDLDGLPFPNFDDYFTRLERSPLRSQITPLLFAETSRGCWWGQRRQCVFCGLNGTTLTFRAKGARRALDELRHLADRYGVRHFALADNILDHRYFDSLMPMLRDAGIGLTFEYEMRTRLSREQVDLLASAGVGAAQLGVESFSTPILRRLHKGTRALDNLQTLKWLTEAGVELKWNLLWGIPGEDPDEYRVMAELLPAIVHFAPPIAVGQVRADRFSPYFCQPAQYGIENLRPHRAFRFVYPLPDESLQRLAYYFEHDFADGRDPQHYIEPWLDAVEQWQNDHHRATLSASFQEDGALVLSDTRPCAAGFQHRLSGLERELYVYCDRGRRFGDLRHFAQEVVPDASPDETALHRLLSDWLDARLMLLIDGHYLALALRLRTGAARKASS